MKKSWMIGLAAVMALVAVPAISADADPAKMVSYRKLSMSAMSKHMKSLRILAKGEVDRPEDWVAHAEAIVMGSRNMVTLYPEGTGPESGLKTSARAEVWTKRADFEAEAKKFTDIADKVLAAAKAGDAKDLSVQLGHLDDSCDTCHEGYKQKRK